MIIHVMIYNTQGVCYIYHILVLIMIALITYLTCSRLCPTSYACVNSPNPLQVEVKELTRGYVGRGRPAPKVRQPGSQHSWLCMG